MNGIKIIYPEFDTKHFTKIASNKEASASDKATEVFKLLLDKFQILFILLMVFLGVLVILLLAMIIP
jgi:hypothetical protein